MKLFTLFAIAAAIPILALSTPLDLKVNEAAYLTDLIPRSDSPPSAAGNITKTQVAFKFNGTDIAHVLNTTLGAIMACPNSVITQGSNATQAWMKSHGYSSSSTMTPDGWWQDTKCALAIATFIGTNLVTAAKLLKIKEYIEALGGVAEAAELLLRCSTWAERLSVGGTALVNLCAEILGVSLIKANCT